MSLLQIVIVLYKVVPAGSESLRCIVSQVQHDPELSSEIELTVYDNSPMRQELPELGFSVSYVHNSQNPGLAVPYNAALHKAESSAIPWMMVLDQDTTLPETFLRKALLLARQQAANTELAAIVPKLKGAHVLSPTYDLEGKKPVDEEASGILPGPLYPFNSGAMFRVASLLQIGGFDTSFPLDYLDYVTFRDLQDRGGHVYVLDAVLSHQLSLDGPEAFENPSFIRRYWSNVIAERRYRHRYEPMSQLVRYYRRQVKAVFWLVKDGNFSRALKHARIILGPTK